MRILFLVPRYPTRSETFLVREVEGLERRGHEVRVVAFRGSGEGVTASGTHYVRNLALPRALPWLLHRRRELLGADRRLRREVTHGGRTVVRLLRAAAVSRLVIRGGVEHLRAHWPAASSLAYLVGAATGVPFSLGIHAHEVAHDAGHFPCVFESLAFATFCNRAAMDYLLDRLPASARERSHLVYHGVDLERFAPATCPETGGALRVVSAGRLSPTKGFDRLLRAVARGRERGLDLRLTLLGDGAERPRLEQLAGELGIGPHLEISGWVPYEEMPRRLAEAHLFALLAEVDYHDGLPNVVLEAQALGRPVILSALPAAREAVVPGENGWILPSAEDVDGFVDHVGTLLGDPDRLESMGRAARHHVEENYDQECHLDGLSGLLEGAWG